MNKKVCMIVANHPFADARIFKKEAKSLQKNGYHVTIITPKQNGKLFDIDGTPFQKQFQSKIFKYEGIKIVTYHLENSQKKLNKVLNHESIWEKEGFQNQLTQLAIQENADIYHAHEYLSLFAGVGVKRLMKKRKNKNVKLIYDSHELTPDPLDTKYSQERRNLLKQQLLIMLKEVDQIITVSDSIKSWYVTHNPGLPTEVIYNSPPLVKGFEPKTFTSNKFTLVYEGNIGVDKEFKEKIIHICEQCSKKMDNFQFKIIGGNRYGDSFKIPDHLEPCIEQTGWVDYYSIPTHMGDIDAGLIDLEGVEQSLNKDYALPNKFFSYLNNGIPVITNKCSEMENFITKHRCGVVLDKTEATSENFANELFSLLQNKRKLQYMSQNGRNVMEKHYSWENMEKRLLAVYQSLSQNY